MNATTATATTNDGLVQLPLIRCQPRLLVNVQRDLAEIDPRLMAVLRDLVGGRKPWPLFLYGLAGGGKTCAALAVCDRASTACYETPETLADKVMGDEWPDLWEWVASKDLAVLDELGARERVGDLHYGVVKRFADAREMHGRRVAIYVSNLKPSEMHRLYDDRVASRILAGTVIHLDAGDRRESQ